MQYRQGPSSPFYSAMHYHALPRRADALPGAEARRKAAVLRSVKTENPNGARPAGSLVQGRPSLQPDRVQAGQDRVAEWKNMQPRHRAKSALHTPTVYLRPPNEQTLLLQRLAKLRVRCGKIPEPESEKFPPAHLLQPKWLHAPTLARHRVRPARRGPGRRRANGAYQTRGSEWMTWNGG